MARHDEIGNRKISAASNPAEPAHSINGYRYRSDSKPAPHSEGLDELKLRLRQHRRLLAFKSTSIRAGTALLNRHLALALVDGVSMRAVAGAARLSHKEVRQACQAFDDLPPSGFTAAVHLQSISSIEKELAALRQSKAAVEAARLNLMATTRRRHVMDDYELALLTGLRPDHIRRMTWGMGPHGPRPQGATARR